MDKNESKSAVPHVRYLPPPHARYLPPPHLTAKSPSPTFKTPNYKKQKLNLPSPNIPTSSPQSIPSPTSMDQNAMDIHIRQQRLNSLDAIIQDNILDNDTDSNTNTYEECKHHIDIDDNDDTNNEKLIALVNSSSGARKGWILARELKQYDASVYYLKDLSCNTTIQFCLAKELEKYNNKCLVLICGGDGSQAWAASLIDKCLLLLPNSNILFPQITVFPMGTGNDLSRCLGWGSLEPNHKNIIQYIADIKFCRKITKRWTDLDRWRVIYTFDHIRETSSVKPAEISDRNKKYEIKPCKQFYIQQNRCSVIYNHLNSFSPPLPNTFLCYLSIGYDALVAYKFAKERRLHPERFNNQIKNQVMYVKHGFTEFFKPSNPINDYIDVIIGGRNINKSLPNGCRSLKVININSAMNGLYFWGKGESRDFEYKQRSEPQLDDSIIEVMATRGVHDMCMYRVNVSHAQRISQTNDIIIRFKKIPKIIGEKGIALQIDGEAWIIKHKCTLRIQIHDKIPTIIGYNAPRGVQSWLMASLNDQHIIKAQESYRNRIKKEYKISIPKALTPSSPALSGISNGSDDDKDKITNNNIISNSFMSLFKSETYQEVDIPQYIQNNNNNNNNTSKKNKNDIFQSIFSPKNNSKNNNKDKNDENKDVFLDRFTWWKVTKYKQHNNPIDAEIATDAVNNNNNKWNRDRNSVKSQSFTVLPKKRLF